VIANKGLCRAGNTKPEKIFGMPAQTPKPGRTAGDLPNSLKPRSMRIKGLKRTPLKQPSRTKLEKCFIQASIINQDKTFPYRILLNFKKSGERRNENADRASGKFDLLRHQAEELLLNQPDLGFRCTL
jgi:hypothetical protein